MSGLPSVMLCFKFSEETWPGFFWQLGKQGTSLIRDETNKIIPPTLSASDVLQAIKCLSSNCKEPLQQRRDQDFIMLHKILPHLKTAMEVRLLTVLFWSKSLHALLKFYVNFTQFNSWASIWYQKVMASKIHSSWLMDMHVWENCCSLLVSPRKREKIWRLPYVVSKIIAARRMCYLTKRTCFTSSERRTVTGTISLVDPHTSSVTSGYLFKVQATY